MALQFDYDQIHRSSAAISRQVYGGSLVLRIACFGAKGFCFPVRKGELPRAVGEEYRSRGGMAVHNRLLVRTIVHLENPHLSVFRDDRVMLRTTLDRILSRHDSRETETHQHHTAQP